jgi:hypothetical protein
MNRTSIRDLFAIAIFLLGFASCTQSVIWFGKLVNTKPNYNENVYNNEYIEEQDNAYYPNDTVNYY